MPLRHALATLLGAATLLAGCAGPHLRVASTAGESAARSPRTVLIFVHLGNPPVDKDYVVPFTRGLLAGAGAVFRRCGAEVAMLTQSSPEASQAGLDERLAASRPDALLLVQPNKVEHSERHLTSVEFLARLLQAPPGESPTALAKLKPAWRALLTYGPGGGTLYPAEWERHGAAAGERLLAQLVQDGFYPGCQLAAK